MAIRMSQMIMYIWNTHVLVPMLFVLYVEKMEIPTEISAALGAIMSGMFQFKNIFPLLMFLKALV